MVMPSKENNHVIPKDREQGEQQTIGTRCYTPPFDSVKASTHRIGSGSTFTEPITGPNLTLKHPDLSTTHRLDLHHTRPPHS